MELALGQHKWSSFYAVTMQRFAMEDIAILFLALAKQCTEMPRSRKCLGKCWMNDSNSVISYELECKWLNSLISTSISLWIWRLSLINGTCLFFLSLLLILLKEILEKSRRICEMCCLMSTIAIDPLSLTNYWLNDVNYGFIDWLMNGWNDWAVRWNHLLESILCTRRGFLSFQWSFIFFFIEHRL